MLEHGHSISNTNAKRATGTPFANHDRNDRSSKTAHLPEVDRDRFRLPTLLGTDTRVRSWSIDETDDRQSVFLGQSHLHERLPIALGMRTTEVAFDLFRGGAALVVPDDQRLHRTDATESRDDRTIVTEVPVPTEFTEITA